MRRREFIAGLTGAAAWPLAARAQQPKVPVVGLLRNESVESGRQRVAAFHRGLADIGYFEGRNIGVMYLWEERDYDRLPALAAEMVRREVTVIAAWVLPSVLAAKAATQTIPIVFLIGSDPVEMGLVASLSRPGGNLTGVTVLEIGAAAKRLELVREFVPAASSIALLVNPTNPRGAEAQTKELQIAARAFGVRLLILEANAPSQIEAAFTSLVQQRAGALVVGGDGLFVTCRDQLVTSAARHSVPTIYFGRDFVEAGGLMSYGADPRESYRMLGSYTGRILKGEKPADLPVQQVTKIDLVINVKTAKALGHAIPRILLARAGELIE